MVEVIFEMDPTKTSAEIDAHDNCPEHPTGDAATLIVYRVQA